MKSLPISLVLLITFSTFNTAAEAKTIRSAAVVLEFKRKNPCPSTNQRRGSCPGYQVDHIEPLCANGPDHVSNLQWLTVEAHKIKTRGDRRHCRALKKTG